jgi:hypothetical protein
MSKNISFQKLGKFGPRGSSSFFVRFMFGGPPFEQKQTVKGANICLNHIAILRLLG